VLRRRSPAPAGARPAPSASVLDEGTRGRVLRVLLATFVTLTVVIAAIGLAVGSPREAAVSAAGAFVYALLLASLDRLGVRRTSYLCTAWYFLLATGAVATGRGVHDVTMVLFPAGLVMGALLLERAHLMPLTVAAVAAVAVVGTAQWAGRLGEPAEAPYGLAEVVVAALLLLVAGVLTQLVVRILHETIERQRHADEASRLAHAELAARNQTLHVLNELTSHLHRSLEIGAIAGETVSVLIRHSRPPLVAFYLLDETAARLRMVAAHGFSDEERALGAELPLEGSLSGIAVREQRLVTTSERGEDPRAQPAVGGAMAARGVSTALCIPLAYGGRPLGTVNLLFTERREFGEIELDAFRAIGQAVSMAIANARHVADLEHTAFHDPLTSLPNRASLHRRFLALGGRGDGRRVGLVLIDLARFRHINEALGHAVGDTLLVEAARRLADAGKRLRVETFRLGGDEFAALLVGFDAEVQSEATGLELLNVLREPFEVEGMTLSVGASAGVALYPDHGGNSHELLRCADVALGRAKRTGGKIASYDSTFDENTPERLALLSELGRAIGDGGLVLHFQPMVELASGRVVGCEALVRWVHPRLGLLMPADFLPSAETSEVLSPLTYWIVESALSQLARWSARRPDLTMAINLSVQILLDRNCSRRLSEIISRVGIEPSRVEFELTETAIMADPESALAMLREITATGARLAIDDFGTGYSSLTYLTRFPVHAIKIDRSFVSGLVHDGQNLAIVRSTLDLARGLGLSVVAEGIEDLQTLEVLRGIGCEVAQGYFLGQPAPAEEIGRRLVA